MRGEFCDVHTHAHTKRLPSALPCRHTLQVVSLVRFSCGSANITAWYVEKLAFVFRSAIHKGLLSCPCFSLPSFNLAQM